MSAGNPAPLDPVRISADLIDHAHSLSTRADEVAAAHDELCAARDSLADVWTGPVADVALAAAGDWISRVKQLADSVRTAARDAEEAAAAVDAIAARAQATLAEVTTVDLGRTPEELTATVDGATLAPAELPAHTREVLATLYPDLISSTEGDVDALAHACREWVDTVLGPVQDAAEQAELDAAVLRDDALTDVLDTTGIAETDPVLERAGVL